MVQQRRELVGFRRARRGCKLTGSQWPCGKLFYTDRPTAKLFILRRTGLDKDLGSEPCV